MMVYLELFIEFFKIGLFAIGGGPATIPFLMDIPNRHDWYQVSDVTNMLAVSESTPGPIGINMATYAGYNAGGILGGVVATFSLVLPSLIVIMLIAKMLDKFSSNMYVKSSFGSIRPAVTGLIAVAVWGIFKTALLMDASGELHFPVGLFLLCLGFFALMSLKKLKKVHPVFWFIAGAAIGIVFKL